MKIKCPTCKSDLAYSQMEDGTHVYACGTCMGDWKILKSQKDKHRALIEDVEAKKKEFKRKKKLPLKYKCPKCGHVCMEREMDADAVLGDVEEECWSNHICPKCGTWQIDLEDWDEVKDD